MGKPTLNPPCNQDAHESGQANLRHEKPFSDHFTSLMFIGLLCFVFFCCVYQAFADGY